MSIPIAAILSEVLSESTYTNWLRRQEPGAFLGLPDFLSEECKTVVYLFGNECCALPTEDAEWVGNGEDGERFPMPPWAVRHFHNIVKIVAILRNVRTPLLLCSTLPNEEIPLVSFCLEEMKQNR